MDLKETFSVCRVHEVSLVIKVYSKLDMMINFLSNYFLIETICSDPSYDEPS